MQKRLTVTLDSRVYQALHDVVEPRQISRFVESVLRPHVLAKDLETGYRLMAQDQALKQNRLAQLQHVAALADGVVDLSRLEGF